jgi:pimeloyl-ACP methyl ester carboxylesterase
MQPLSNPHAPHSCRQSSANRVVAEQEWVIFEHSAHMPHLEEPERYLQVLQDFFCRHDPSG